MDKFIVYNSKLKGDVTISGAKNAALPILSATLLTDKLCVLKNVPDLLDIRTMLKILQTLGKEISFKQGTVVIKSTGKREKYTAPYSLVRTMRASFCCLGPLLAKNRKAKVALPGGCVIGPRPVDLHIKGLMKLGADIKINKGYCIASAKRLKGAHIYLGGQFGSSVLATANVMMAAVLSKGITIIEHAACEPEIIALGIALKKMGANIEGEGTPIITINGVDCLNGLDETVIPDRIEAATFLAAALVTRSDITIKKVNFKHLTAVLEAMENMGAVFNIKEDSIGIKSPKVITPVSVTTLPYPGFPTDVQAQLMSCLCFAKGISMITEKIYPDRFMHIAELNRMGAGIQRSGPYAIIEGRRRLFGAEVMASDLRASAALVIAGLAAEDKTEILRVYHIDRGYEYIETKLRHLGAKVKRVKQK
ncbi:MAG: UDP-N-acetylglucosamine 1-carboxyvinyltransferase [Candidatus Omnitrophota bacterium]